MIADIVTLVTDLGLLAPLVAAFTAGMVLWGVGALRRAVRG